MMLKPLFAPSVWIFAAAKASAMIIIVPLGIIVAPPAQVTADGVIFTSSGTNSAYYEFSVSRPNTIAASSFTNSAVDHAGLFDFGTINLYSGSGVDGSLLDSGMISTRIAGTERAYLAPRVLSVGDYTIAYTGMVLGTPASVGSSITFAAGFIPEPSAWLLMIAGFGFVGLSARHRQRGTAA